MNDLLSNPFVLLLLSLLSAILGAIGSKVLDRTFAKADRDNGVAVQLAGRLATLEAVVAHVSADQAAHAKQSADLNELKIAVAELRVGMVAIGKQNRAIWKKLTTQAA